MPQLTAHISEYLDAIQEAKVAAVRYKQARARSEQSWFIAAVLMCAGVGLLLAVGVITLVS